MATLVQTAVYSGIPVWEIQVGPVSVVRKQTDHSINITHFLNVLNVHRLRREQFLSHYRSLPLAHCWVVHGGPARLKGTWGPFAGVKGLVAELGQQELFACLLDETLVPDLALVAAVPSTATVANAGVPVMIAHHPASTAASGSAKASPIRPLKRQAARRKRSDSTSSSDLSSIPDSDLTDFSSDDDELPPTRSAVPRRSGLRQHVPLRSGTRTSTRHLEIRKGKERERLAVDALTDGSVEATSSLKHVEELLPELLPDVSVFQQLFGPSRSQNAAALAYLRDMKVPKLAPDYDDSDEDELIQETTPKDTISIDGVRIQGTSSAGSDSSQQLNRPPPMPQSPSSLVGKDKNDRLLPRNLGQLFDLKLKQREAKLAALVSSPARRQLDPHHHSPMVTSDNPSTPPHQVSVTVDERRIQRLQSEHAKTETLVSGLYSAAPALAFAQKAPTPPNYLGLAPMLPIVPATDCSPALSRCPPLFAELPN